MNTLYFLWLPGEDLYEVVCFGNFITLKISQPCFPLPTYKLIFSKCVYQIS